MRTYKTTSETGLEHQSFPLRLYHKAKKLGIWDPRDIDFTQDKADWAQMPDTERDNVLRILSHFQSGEEAVTVDLLPLVDLIAQEGRVEEEMFLTTFLFEEAKHTEFFRRFLDEVAQDQSDLARYHSPAYRTIFYERLPEAMGRLRTDKSREAVVEASITYNMIVEGVIAETGYFLFFESMKKKNRLPGLVEGLTYTKRDESRHVSFGTYLIQRCLQDDPGLWGLVNQKLSGFIPVLVQYIQENFCPDQLPTGVDYNDFLTYSTSLLQSRLATLQRALHRSIDEIYRVGEREVEIVEEAHSTTG
ncbi:R2-like ligand-binding oxidase [Alicyclobacillus cycloheptanicus]|uniref:R2-like ligand binding oxidase n=1 Tax=Alicyclobacillus cycloheptanicus TaxID=1457 RepID=A0ABT9XJ72_9BACL|nr:R2-like ligand-binding oxidase [Alicyclobacillus cycloheptanicus]MDQ0190247.1 ribonucleoside-diphosphate reductase beta chain [Alicyclobacillus cycloheptanicus]